MPPPRLAPRWRTPDGAVKIYCGHVLDLLPRLPAGCVQCVVTSPPYWALRDYQTEPVRWPDGWVGSYGSEPTPQMYVDHTVLIFREVRRVLRDDGTVWLNIGDSYAGGKVGRDDLSKRKGAFGNGDTVELDEDDKFAGTKFKSRDCPGLVGGNLVGVPWRVALALQADGWVLRQDIIWGKPSPMPESVTNRCTKSHEYVFLLTKRGSGYYYDAEAVKEKSAYPGDDRGASPSSRRGTECNYMSGGPNGSNRNKRSVWTISSQPFPGAHFATFPPKLVEPCVKAGTSEFGACGGCGTPYRRVTEETKLTRSRPNEYVKRTGEEGTGNSCGNTVAGVETVTLGWEPTCACDERRRAFDHGPAGVRPCVVLDPFIGSGTTAMVCMRLGRYCVGVELNQQYVDEHCVARVYPAWEEYAYRVQAAERVNDLPTGLFG